MKPRFTHWALHVQNLHSSVEFYCKFCGMEVIREHGNGPNDHAIWMSDHSNSNEIVLVLLLGGRGKIQKSGDLSHFGFAVSNMHEVDEIADLGRAEGRLAWEAEEFPYPVGYRCAVFDPDGYVVEFSFGQPI